MTERSSEHPLSCAGRKLAYSAFHTYQQIPKNVDVQSPGDDVRLQVLRCSNSFREQIKLVTSDVSKLAEVLAETNDSTLGNQDALELDYDALYSIEKSWQICEIFCLNPTKLISIELIKWLKVKLLSCHFSLFHLFTISYPVTGIVLPSAIRVVSSAVSKCR